MLNDMNTVFPSDKSECEKIAKCSSEIDNLFTLHQRKPLLTIKIIFPWEQRKLYEVAEFNPRSELPEEFEYVDLESVVGTEMVSHRTETRETAPSRAQRLAQTGDVFFQTVRSYQRNNYFSDSPGSFQGKNKYFSKNYKH